MCIAIEDEQHREVWTEPTPCSAKKCKLPVVYYGTHTGFYKSNIKSIWENFIFLSIAITLLKSCELIYQGEKMRMASYHTGSRRRRQ